MKIILWPCVFAAVFAPFLIAGNSIVMGLPGHDPMYFETNRWVFSQIWPLLTAVATLSAFLGARGRLRAFQNEWPSTIASAIVGGSFAATILLALVSWPLIRRAMAVLTLTQIARYVFLWLLLMTPGVVAYAWLRVYRRRGRRAV